MNVSWELNIATLIMLASTAVTVLVFSFKTGRMMESIVNMKSNLDEMEQSMKKLSDVLLQVALQNQRMDSIDQRIEDLRRGDGLIVKRHLQTDS